MFASSMMIKMKIDELFGKIKEFKIVVEDDVMKFKKEIKTINRNIRSIHHQLVDNEIIDIEDKYLKKTKLELREANAYLSSPDSSPVFGCATYDVGAGGGRILLDYSIPVNYYLIKEGWTQYNTYRRSVKKLTEEEFELMSGNDKIEVVDDTIS